MDVTLRTRRLLLRQPQPTDATRTARLLNNFAVSGKLARVPYPYKLSDAEWWLGTWRADKPAGETNFIIDLPGEGLIGNCGLHQDNGATVIGYYLGEPFWNRGFMTEAAAAVIDWYFEASGASHLDSGAFAFNKASLAVQKKLGFSEMGSGRKHCLARQEDLRHIDTRLTRARWDERRAGASAREPT
jgi:RimJ/RimL family protein N-acetyltransferase